MTKPRYSSIFRRLRRCDGDAAVTTHRPVPIFGISGASAYGEIYGDRKYVDKPSLTIANPCTVFTGRERKGRCEDSSRRERANPMLLTKNRRPTVCTPRGWAIAVLQEVGAIRE
jgi:hypothetical protein